VSRVPAPSDEVLVRLATIAARAGELLVPDSPMDKPRIGVQTMKNDRRRMMEDVLVLLADRDLRDYLAELERLDFLPSKG
jgi:hypothetical protein